MDTVDDETCFLFGVKKPFLLAPDGLAVVLFTVDVATSVVAASVVPLSTSCYDGFMLVTGGLSGVTFVSIVGTCLSLMVPWAMFVITSARIGFRFIVQIWLTLSSVAERLIKVELHDNARESVSTTPWSRETWSPSALLYFTSCCT